MTDQRPIILWAHPKSCSTVFERPFLQLDQEFCVFHEPLLLIRVAHYTKNEKILNNIQSPKPTDPITFPHYFTPTLNEIIKPRYHNGDQTKPLRVFVKDFAKIYFNALKGNPLQSKEILSKFKHTFLFRNSEQSVKSFYKAANASYKAQDEANAPISERFEFFSAEQIGLKELRAFYDLIKNVTGKEIALVDSDDLVRKPEKILRKYCEMVGVEFKKEMLEWKAEEELRFWDLNLPNLFYLPDLYKIWHKYVYIFF